MIITRDILEVFKKGNLKESNRVIEALNKASH